ncbi:MAG: OmpA family protein [Bdellovibrionaceae bacterium]|nr:OmpA family protein [Pseudobdellovibrionaceae bacterium]
MRKVRQNKVSLLLKKENEVWLYSYADLITNLLAFFILLFVLVNGSPAAVSKIKTSLSQLSEGVIVAPNTPDFTNTVSSYIKEKRLVNQVAIQANEEGISLTFQGNFLFETMSSEIRPLARDLLSNLVPLLKKIPKDFRIDVCGHADSRKILESDYFPSNWELSAARAGSVVRYLASQNIDQHRLRAIGYGDTQPVSNNLEENRRVVIKIGRGRSE